MLSDIVEERPGPRRVRHMGSGLHITMSESNHQCFVFVFFIKGFAGKHCAQIVELMASGQGLLEVPWHMP